MHNGVGIAMEHQTRPLQILIIDDSETIRKLVKNILKSPKFQIFEASDTNIGKKTLQDNDIDLILLDIRLEGESGLTFLGKIRQEKRYAMIPIVMLTVVDEIQDIIFALNTGATDYITKPFDPAELSARVSAHAERKRLMDDYIDIRTVLLTLGKFAEAKDPCAKYHAERCSRIAQQFGQHLELMQHEINLMYYGALLHDVGKMVIPDPILLKPGALTAEERKIIEKHPAIGAELCSPLRTLAPIVDIVHHHHERWDGTGYPDGLKGEKISIFTRAFQLIDIFESLTAKRVYRKALSIREAINIMMQEVENGLLDPDLTRRFTLCIEETGRDILK